MVLVFASQLDEIAQAAVAGWPESMATLLTVDDLSIDGWSINNKDFSRSTIVASGQQYSVADLSGVVTLLPYIMEHELFRIEEPNRRYVATEMTAFLYYVFTSLKCPLINKPSAYNLTGPNWRYEEWLRACQRVSLPIKPYRRQFPEEIVSPNNAIFAPFETKTIIVLNKRVIVSHAEAFNVKVLQLAELAGVEYLEIIFAEENSRFFLCSANCIPNMNEPQVLTELYESFNK
jgi:hypothetical protein